LLSHCLVDPRTKVLLEDAAESILPQTLAISDMATAQKRCEAILWLLGAPRDPPHREQFSNNEMMVMWEQHKDGNCKDCVVGKSLSAPYETFVSTNAEGQLQLLEAFRVSLLLNLKREAEEEVQHFAKLQEMFYTATTYQPLHPLLFMNEHWSSSTAWQFEDILDDTLLAVLQNNNNSGGIFQEPGDAEKFHICREDTTGVFSFPFFKKSFCDLLVAEIRNYESCDKMPRFRPNSMNRYGVVVNEIGLQPFLNMLCHRVIFPIAHLLLPTFTHNNSLDQHHSFVVEYRKGQDTFLDMHSDDSEVTLNVNILDTFQGSSLCFCGMTGDKKHRKHKRSYEHALGRAVLHAGAHRHGALPLTGGERMNLIVWCQSSWARQHGEGVRYFHPREEAPDKVCLSRTHDPDFSYWEGTVSTVSNGGIS
jgi:hypothetical protein